MPLPRLTPAAACLLGLSPPPSLLLLPGLPSFLFIYLLGVEGLDEGTGELFVGGGSKEGRERKKVGGTPGEEEKK